MKNIILECLRPDSLKEEKQLLESLCSLLSEFIGTGMLMFLGCMGCTESEIFENNNLIKCLNFGLVVLIVIQCFGRCSGAHINPAVSLASYIYDMLSFPMMLAYILSQVLGAICGYGLLKVLLPTDLIQVPGKKYGLCMTVVHSSIATWQGLCIEICITSALVWVCCAVWDPRNEMLKDSIPIRFGLAVASLSLTGGPFTGASMNPARSLAPAIWNNQMEDHWVYWVGPLLASLFAANLYKYVFRREQNDTEETPKTKSETTVCCA